MTEGGQLLLILWLIYLSGCIFWVDRRTLLFASGFGRRWRAVAADYRWGNTSGRVWILNPLPPFGYFFAARLPPFSLSPRRIVAYNAQTVGNSGRPRQSRRIAPISSATVFSRRGTVLKVDGKTFCDVRDVGTAHRLVVLLNAIKAKDEQAREREIKAFWRERLSPERTKAAMHEALSASRAVRRFGIAAFALLLVALPLASTRVELGFVVLAGAAGMVVTSVSTCLLLFACHRRRYPVFKEGLASELVKMLLCAPNALRAADLVMERLSGGLDALALGSLLLDGADREAFMREYIADLEAPDMPESLPDDVRETCLWQHRAILEAAAERGLTGEG